MTVCGRDNYQIKLIKKHENQDKLDFLVNSASEYSNFISTSKRNLQNLFKDISILQKKLTLSKEEVRDDES